MHIGGGRMGLLRSSKTSHDRTHSSSLAHLIREEHENNTRKSPGQQVFENPDRTRLKKHGTRNSRLRSFRYGACPIIPDGPYWITNRWR